MGAERYVIRSLERIADEGLHGIREPVPKGYLRGVEMLGDDFAAGMARPVGIYRRNHGAWPDLIDPRTFANNQLLFKFFGLIPRVSPSDKLRAQLDLMVEAAEAIGQHFDDIRVDMFLRGGEV